MKNSLIHGQHLFEAIAKITGHQPLESEMQQILRAVEQDNEMPLEHEYYWVKRHETARYIVGVCAIRWGLKHFIFNDGVMLPIEQVYSYQTILPPIP